MDFTDIFLDSGFLKICLAFVGASLAFYAFTHVDRIHTWFHACDCERSFSGAEDDGFFNDEDHEDEMNMLDNEVPWNHVSYQANRRNIVGE